MNYGRLVAAAAAATVVDGIYGFIVYGNLLTSQFLRFPGVFRSMESQPPYMAGMFGGIFLAMLAATAMFAKGYEGGSGVAEGARFGLLVGVVTVGYGVLVNHAIMNLDGTITLAMAAAALVEWTVAGVVVGLVYKPKS